jgi:hypothetical protein
VKARAEVTQAGLPVDQNKVTPLKRAENASSAFQRAMDGSATTSPINEDAAAKLAELESLSYTQNIEARLQAAKEMKKSA